MREYIDIFNLLIVPVFVWVVLIERRITKIETIIESRSKKREGDLWIK